MNKSLFTFCFLLIFSHFCSAQMSAGFMLGCISYQGDLSKGAIDTKEINVSYGLSVTKRYSNPKFAMKGQIQTGRITGNDVNYPDRWNRGLKFKSPVTFLGGTVEITPFAKKPFDLNGDFVPQKNIYFATGLGFTFFNPKVTGLPDKAPDKMVEISKTMFTLPLTAGVRFDLDPKWSFGLEASYYMPFTDYLDGISAAGTPNNYDSYLFLGFSLVKKWGDLQGFTLLKEDKKPKGKKRR